MLNQKENVYVGKKLGSQTIFPWIFYKDNRDDKLRIEFYEMLVDSNELGQDEVVNIHEKILHETQITLERCISKFIDYPKDLKVIALSYYCDELYDLKSITNLFNSIEVPEVIDEIWVEIREWINADESIPRFVCVYCK